MRKRMVYEHVGTKMFPGHIWVPVRCLGRYGHQNGAWEYMGNALVSGHVWALKGCTETYGKEKFSYEHMGTDRVPGHILAPEWCPGTYGHWKGARHIMGTRRVPGTYAREHMGTVTCRKQLVAWAHMAIGRLARHIWTLFPGTYGYQNAAQINTGTERVLGNIWELKWNQGTYGHRYEARSHMGREGCPGTYWNRKGVRSSMGTGRVHRHI